MAVITSENKQAWQGVFKSCEQARPYKGRTAQVIKGKHKGFSGEITWHGVDKYYSTQYDTPAQAMMRQAMGTTGYRVRITNAEGISIFVSANEDYLKVLA